MIQVQTSGVIQVQTAGMFTTVQDLGRYGYGPLGVSPSGAADPISLRIGNLLVGNPENTAALEMTLLGGTFLFPDGGVVALAGSDFGPVLSNPARQGGDSLDAFPSSSTRQGGDSLGAAALPSGTARQGGDHPSLGAAPLPIPMHTAIDIPPGGILKTGPSRNGARCYLCVAGGIAVRPLLGSASTHILTGLGGFEGRALRKGDVLEVGLAQHAVGQGHALPGRGITVEILDKLAPRKTLRTTIAPQTDWFPADSLRRFYEGIYTVSEESNRMGLRLQGPAIEVPQSEAPNRGQMTSEGVSLGAIQIPAGGQPIILFVEQQTTGGYPKIANIISADLSSIGQLRPRDQIRFELVTPEAARALIREQEALLRALS
jgi:antagonist of KipI